MVEFSKPHSDCEIKYLGLGARGSWWHRKEMWAKQLKCNLFPGSTSTLTTQVSPIREPPGTNIAPHIPPEVEHGPL